MPFVSKKFIQDLKDEIERLKFFEARYREDGKRKRSLEKKQRDLLHSFFQYKNYVHENKNGWPETLCYQCGHCLIKPSPSGKAQTKYRCKASGAYVAKYGCCNAVKSRPGKGGRER